MEKLLIVDDSSFSREVLIDILKPLNKYKILIAKEGKEALNIAKKELPQIVILDIVMPMMDGIECLVSMKEIIPKARFVMCSAMNHAQTVNQVLELGASEFVSKPFNRERVIAVVKNNNKVEGV